MPDKVQGKIKRKPEWLKVQKTLGEEAIKIKKMIREGGLHTVCESALCPNLTECFKKRTATFLILGNICTRHCRFCNISSDKEPLPVDPAEPEKIAQTVKDLGLSHVVITSVTRDDLYDGGAEQFARCIKQIRKLDSSITIEVLTPDFKNQEGALEEVLAARPNVFNHNIETIPRLYPQVRPEADYEYSLEVLKKAKKTNRRMYVKSGFMLGLGEGMWEIFNTMTDLINSKVDILTMGQYLQPTFRHYPVDKYLKPDIFDFYKKAAYLKGFKAVVSSPFTRSSHNAKDVLQELEDMKK